MRRFEIAHVTVVRLQTEMILLVTDQFFFELEPLITLITLEWALVSMIRDDVRLEMIPSRTSKLALVTLVWCFAFNNITFLY